MKFEQKGSEIIIDSIKPLLINNNCFGEGCWVPTGKFKVDGVLYNADNEDRVIFD